jgi:acid phosphatase family membrane protein YuiD
MSSGIIFGNKVLDVVFISMFSAQIYKLITSSIINKKFAWSRMWETGGMPSSHSSSVISLATAVAITQGMDSIAFAISVVFSVVVMYDAAGIRKAAGEHAGIINQLTDFFTLKYDKKFHNEKLKELLGHSRSEVLVGAIVGFLIALLMKGYLLR